jgi:phytoene synthase
VVGLMMTRVFTLGDKRYETQAVQLGLAMQLTNILRDVKEDLAMNRVYLPREELLRFHLDPDHLETAAKSPFWGEFMKFQIARARDYYIKAEEGIRALPNNGAQRTTWLMRHVYSGILEEIEKARYQSFKGRVYVSTPRKLLLAVKAFRSS